MVKRVFLISEVLAACMCEGFFVLLYGLKLFFWCVYLFVSSSHFSFVVKHFAFMDCGNV